MKKELNSNVSLMLILLVVGFEWVRSSISKLQAGDFAGTMPGTLEKFVSKNPYPWFVDFLRSSVMPNAEMFGTLVQLGELFAAITITVGIVYMFAVRDHRMSLVHWMLIGGLLVGAFLNVMFWLAAGWTSPSTDGLNLLMAASEIVGFLYLTKTKILS